MTQQEAGSRLTSGTLLARNAVWNLIAQVAPLAFAIVAIPFLIRGMGADRFGVLSLVLGLIGYVSLFDLGTGRTLTKLVADRAVSANADISDLVGTSVATLFVVGCLAAVPTFAGAGWLASSAFHIPSQLRDESTYAFELLAASLPFTTVSAGLRGVLEGRQLFVSASIIRALVGISYSLGPLAAVLLGGTLPLVVITVLVSRIGACVAYAYACNQTVSLRELRMRLSQLPHILSFGGWLQISAIASPILSYSDRFAIGVLLSSAAVAYYAIPSEAVQRLLVIPVAFTGVAFPAYATSLSYNTDRARILFNRTVKFLFLALFPIVLVGLALAPEVLGLWLGSDLAARITEVTRILLVGVFVNAIAYVPFAFIVAAGRPDITAKVNAAELPVFLVVLAWLVASYGILGAAIAWLVRATAECLVLFVFALRFVNVTTGNRRLFAAVSILVILSMGVVLLPANVVLRSAIAVFIVGLVVLVGWNHLLSSGERAGLIAVFRLSRQ